MLTGLFDEQVLLKKLDQKTDPLARLNSIVDWQIFLPIIEKALGREDSASAGRKPYPPLLMFKILILQSLYKLSDEGVERELLKDPWPAVSSAFQDGSSGRMPAPSGASRKP